MRSQLAVAAIRRVRAVRGERAVRELLDAFALDPSVEAARDLTLPVAEHRAFMDAAARAADDPRLGIHLARDAGRDLFGVLSFSARVSPTLREACRRIVRYVRLSNDAVDVVFDEDADGNGALRHRVEGEPLCLGRHDNEFFVTVIVEEARRLTQAAASPRRVWVAHAPPRGIRLDEELRVGAVTYEAGENGVEYAARDLDTPLVTADAALLEYLDAQAQSTLAALSASRGVVATAHAALRERLEGAAPTLDVLAKALGVSARSLQRRLADEGTSFQAVLDDVREAVARTHVAEGRLSLGEVAHRVGYAEVRPFLRAFKRWTGLTPTQYREQAAVARAPAARRR